MIPQRFIIVPNNFHVNLAHTIQQASGLVSPGIDSSPNLESEAKLEGRKAVGNKGNLEKQATNFNDFLLKPKLETGIAAKTVNLEGKSVAIQRKELVEPNGQTQDWNNRLFSANLTGTDGDRRIDFTLDRIANKITGSFAIHSTGRGNITKGLLNAILPRNSDYSSIKRLVAQEEVHLEVQRQEFLTEAREGAHYPQRKRTRFCQISP